MNNFLSILLEMALESAPFLLFGLAVAGCLVWLLPQSRLGKWLAGSGPAPVFKAALMGIPFPLCSCSVVPVATGLLRGGASPGATLSFLISTPENGADSLALSYVLLGPVMTIARPISALCSAITAGLLAPTSLPGLVVKPACGCCGGDKPRTLKQCLTYALTTLLDDLIPWLLFGLLVAALLACVLEPTSLAAWGSGLTAKLLMVIVGVPMYICASASTPVAASLLAAGMSSGTVLVPDRNGSAVLAVFIDADGSHLAQSMDSKEGRLKDSLGCLQAGDQSFRQSDSGEKNSRPISPCLR